MPLAPTAQREEKTPPLQTLEDLKKKKKGQKKKIKTEKNEDVESLDNVPISETVKQGPALEYEKSPYVTSSSSGLGGLEGTESDSADLSDENAKAQLAIDKPQERSKRSRNVAKTYAESDSSSEDVGDRYKGREIVGKNTWVLNGSEESEIDSTASYTSEDGSDCSEERSVASNLSVSDGEADSELEHDSLDKQLDPVYAAQHSAVARQSLSPAGRNVTRENSRKISPAKLKYMITHGTLNKVQRSKSWGVIAEECGVTAPKEDIYQALKEAGIPDGDRISPKPQAAPSTDQDALSVSRSLSSQASKSHSQNSGSSTILTTRDLELVVVAFQCLKPGCELEVDYGKLADLAGLKNPASASAVWMCVRKKLGASYVPLSRLSARDVELLGFAFQSLKVGCIFQIDQRKFAGLAGFSSASSGIASWLVVQKQLTAASSIVATMSPAAATPLQKRKRSATTIVLDESESEDSMPAPKKRRDYVLPSRKSHTSLDSHQRHPHNTFSRDRNSNVEMVWDLEAEHMLLLAIIEVRGYKMDYEAVAERLGCTGKAVSHHLAKLRKEIRGRKDPIPLVRFQNATRPTAGTNRPIFTEAAVMRGAKPHDSTARLGLPKATHTKTALFIKNEIAKLEANLTEDHDLAPWSKEEESALERGLRRFSGPYWSDILGLFGPNGSVSDVLKDRGEAQMEDKACRMKISFLKKGVKFPFYLRPVTGGRRNTAPTVVVDDGEGERGTGEDHSHVKGGVAVTPDEKNTPLGLDTAGEAAAAGVTLGAPEHVINLSLTS